MTLLVRPVPSKHPRYICAGQSKEIAKTAILSPLRPALPWRMCFKVSWFVTYPARQLPKRLRKKG